MINMFDYYFAIIFFTVFIMIIMLLMIHNNELLEDSSRISLKVMAFVVIIASISEWMGVQLNNAPLWTRPFHIIVKVVELSVAPTISFICTGILVRIKNWKLVGCIIIFNALLELISGFTGFIFNVDSNNVYHHGEFYWIYLTVIFGGIILFIVVTLSESRRQYGTHKVLMLLLPFFMIISFIFQYSALQVRVIWLCTAVNVLIIYIMHVEETQNLDALTHLMNRRYYENRIAGLKEPAVVFYFDVDDFKNINDSYGHRFGDVALATIGRTIHAIFSKDGYCYRIGGDEFAAITYIPLSKAEDYCHKIFAAMELHRKREPKLPYISVGFAFYDPQKSSIADVINEADAMMYDRKKRNKAARNNINQAVGMARHNDFT